MSKKKGEEPPKLTLGRLGTSLSVGIVGLPNVGKSSLFNLLTKSEVPAENFPFCTKDPNNARVAVPDARFDHLVSIFKPASAVPAFLQVTDIAGLVKGASSGEGLGNAFLSHIRAVDAIFQVVRIFDNPEITHVEGAIDAIRDLEIINEELRMKDLEFVRSQYDSLENVVRRGIDKTKKEELEVVTTVLQWLEDGKPIRSNTEWKQKEIEVLNRLQLITAKPVVYLANMTPYDYTRKKNKWLPRIARWINENAPGETLIPFSCKLEEDAVAGVAPEDFKSQVEKIILSGYQLLDLGYFFTAGADEVKCWTIRNGTKAPQAAGKIHTDFEKTFVCAEVMSYDDFIEYGDEVGVRAAGKYRQHGREYVVADGDIIHFRCGAARKRK